VLNKKFTKSDIFFLTEFVDDKFLCYLNYLENENKIIKEKHVTVVNELRNLKELIYNYYIKQISSPLQLQLATVRTSPISIKIKLPDFAFYCMFGRIDHMILSDAKVFESLLACQSIIRRKHTEHNTHVIFEHCKEGDHRPTLRYNKTKQELIITIYFVCRTYDTDVIAPILFCGCTPPTLK